MPLIIFKPSDITVDIEAGSELLDAAKKAGISVEVPCGGNGICGKCIVKIESGKVIFNNNGVLPSELIDEGCVLICKTKVSDEDLCVHVFTPADKEYGKFSDTSEDMLSIDKELMPHKNDFNPLVKKIFLIVPPPAQGDGLSDFDRLKKAVLDKCKGTDLVIPVNILKILPNVLRENDGKVTVAYFEKNNIINVVDIEVSDISGKNFGIAVDIGTTTIAVQLVDMADGNIIASKTDYNAQIECGLDVISRINYAKKHHHLEELTKKVLGTINGIIKELTLLNDIDHRQIFNASIAGNTTMIHLLLGIIPEYIRLDPYTPAIYNVPYFKAKEIGIYINENTIVYIAPSVGSYVGADITSGLLCTKLSAHSEEIDLFIDIGTNGEIVLGNNDFLLGCACSAGPAFEGGGIEKGMRASEGAIEWVEIDKDTGVSKYVTIGNAPPVGICGSGIISLISELFTKGFIDAAGKLNRALNCPSIEAGGKNAKYIITPAKDTPDGKEVYITDADIDNFIRAKAAIFSACRVMLQKIHLDFEDLSRIYIAGGFGRYLDIEKATTIGLLPKLPKEKFVFIGNASLIGAYMTLMSDKHREKQSEIAGRITYIDLSTEHEYMDQYTAALFLPHTDLGLFK